MKRSARLRTIATALAATFTLVNIAAAQTDREVVAAVYEASARVSSNIRGVNTFGPAPAGFNPLTASDMELATYGFPPRPNATTDSEHYGQWARAMKAAKVRWNGNLKDMGAYSTPAKIVHSLAPDVTGTITSSSTNWSGIVNTNKLKTWSPKTSVYYVISDFTVPVAQPPFGACGGCYDLRSHWMGLMDFSVVMCCKVAARHKSIATVPILLHQLLRMD
jgi:hypothetical protein